MKFEIYDEKSDKIRTVSLLPKQIRECEEAIASLKSQEAAFIANKEAKKIRETVLTVVKEASALEPEQVCGKVSGVCVRWVPVPSPACVLPPPLALMSPDQEAGGGAGRCGH